MRVYFTGVLILLFGFISAQELKDSNAIEVNYFTGNIIQHAPDLAHLITGHPEGVLFSFSKKTHGRQEWQSAYNFPDYGFYFLYQDFKNEFLGHNYAIGIHYNFYFLKRKLMFKVAEGIALASNPHDNVTNSKNGAFGSKLLGNVNFVLNYKKDNLIDKFGIEAGFIFTHFSNARIKAPNSGINTWNINVGLNYNFDNIENKIIDSTSFNIKFKQPVKYNLVLRSGINESPIVGSGTKPFYHIGFFADKRLNRKSAIQFGAELFLTNSFIEFIKYKSIAYPNLNINPNTDYKRVGVFVGHELFINKISLEAQIGYYVYKPFKNDIAIYDRLGMKYYLSNKIFTGVSIKTHGFLAEAMEFAVGVRL
ncbi:MAG: hypothetical protein RL308_847 [Bacteroidota bacterium]|jgi:hypothetical protein